MSELTNERLEEYARDGRNAGDVEVEQMARELLTLRTLRDAGAKEKLIRMVRLMCLDNDMGTEPVEKWSIGWNLPVLLEQASRMPDEEIDTLTTGEESIVEALVVKYGCRDLHDWLNEVFENGESMGIVTPVACLVRDAGDEEVEKWHKKIKDAIQIDYFDSDWDNAPTVLIDKLRDIVITRGQQLREARAEIERLKSRKIECCTCGHEMAEVDGQFGCEHCDHEYDGTCECWQCHHSREHESMQSQITTLTAELAALKSCPAMAEKEIEDHCKELLEAWHTHARRHHRAECRCERCSYGGCTDRKPCNLCLKQSAT